jgi:hypothetical protein
MPDDTTRRHHLLTTALVGALLPADVPEGHVMRAWLDSWAGVGHVVESMRALGYNVRLTRSPFVRWAEFCRDEVNPVPRWSGGYQAGSVEAGVAIMPGHSRRLRSWQTTVHG